MINGMVAVPVMAIMMLMTANRQIMGQVRHHGPAPVIGWIATAVMAAAAGAMIITSFTG